MNPFFLFFGGHLFLGRKTVKTSDFSRKIRLNIGEDFFFFSWRSPVFERKNRLNFLFRPRKIRLNFGEDLFFSFFGDHLFLGGKTASILNQPFESFLEIRVKVAYSCLTLSKKPPLFQILAPRLHTVLLMGSDASESTTGS